MDALRVALSAWWVPYLLMSALVGIGVAIGKLWKDIATRKDVQTSISACRTEQEEKRKKELEIITAERREIWDVVRKTGEQTAQIAVSVSRIEGYLQQHNGYQP